MCLLLLIHTIYTVIFEYNIQNILLVLARKIATYILNHLYWNILEQSGQLFLKYHSKRRKRRRKIKLAPDRIVKISLDIMHRKSYDVNLCVCLNIDYSNFF